MTSGEGEEHVVVVEEELSDVARLAFFSDAAVAISLTLLFIPVSDYVREKPDTNWSTLFIDNPEIIQSAAAFVTVLVCWRYHHVLYERLRSYSRATVWLNFLWLFCVVSLPLLTLAILPEDSADSDDYENFFSTVFIKGEGDISQQNYVVLWVVTGISFFALFLISRHASVSGRGLAKPGTNLSSERWVYLRPTIVCFLVAIAGLVFRPAIGDLVLIVGIIACVFIARVTSPKGESVTP